MRHLRMVEGPDAAHVARPLILLITPTDRHGDARRLNAIGVRVIATSRAESNVRQVFDASPAIIAVEWVPSLAAETLAYVAELMLSTRSRRIPVLVYGNATDTLRDEVGRTGAEWVYVTASERGALVRRVREWQS